MNKKTLKLLVLLLLLCSPVFPENIITEADSITGNKSQSTLILEGNAHVSYSSINIFADYIKIDKINGTINTIGNVKATMENSKITGSELIYLIDNKNAIILDGTLSIDSFRFSAKKIESLDQDSYHLTGAKFTSCPEGCDKWFFKAKDIKLKREGYVTFKSLKFEINGKTYLYLPAFIYPAKTKRSAGLLMPSFGSSSKYGFKFNQEIFVPIGNSHDITFETDYYAKSGTGLGFEYRLSRKIGEFGRFYGYSINDNLKKTEEGNSTKRNFSDITYQYNSKTFTINLDSFEGNDFDIVRDFNFDKYSFAMRQFYTDFNMQLKKNNFDITLGMNRKKIIFKNNIEQFSSLPSINVSSKNLFFLGRAVNVNAGAEIIDSPLFEDNLTRSTASFTSRKSYQLSAFNLMETEEIKYTNYSNNNILKSNLSSEFSLKLISPAMVKQTEGFKHSLNFFAKAGYRNTSEKFPDSIYDLYDTIKQDGTFVQTGIESTLFLNNITATGGIYIEKSLGSNYFHNSVFTEKTSNYAPISGYFSIPFKNFDIGLEASYDTTLNEIDKLMVSTNIAKTLRIAYLKAYTYGEEEKRDSIVASYSKQINDKWSTGISLDYDFKISSLRYQVYSITYYNKCIGFSLKYLNNTYTIRDDNEITISLILKDIGEFLKYKMGL